MCGGVHNGKVEGLVSVERWSCSRGVLERALNKHLTRSHCPRYDKIHPRSPEASRVALTMLPVMVNLNSRRPQVPASL